MRKFSTKVAIQPLTYPGYIDRYQDGTAPLDYLLDAADVYKHLGDYDPDKFPPLDGQSIEKWLTSTEMLYVGAAGAHYYLLPASVADDAKDLYRDCPGVFCALVERRELQDEGETIHTFVVPKSFVKDLDEDPEVGDFVYLNPKDRDDPLHLGLHPDMRAINKGIVKTIRPSFNNPDQTVYTVQLDGRERTFNYSRNWISFLPGGEILEKKKEVKAVDVDGLLNKDAIAHSKFNFPLEQKDKRCSYSVVVKKEGGAVGLVSHWGDVCHARCVAESWKDEVATLGVVDYITPHLDRGGYGLPCFKDRNDYKERFIEFYEYWANKGPFSRVIKTKSIFDAIESGVRYDCSFSPSAIAATAVGMRMMGEFPEEAYAFTELRKVFKDHAALFLAFMTNYDKDDKEWSVYFRGWHDLLPPTATIGLIRDFETGDAFPMYKQPAANACKNRYAIYAGLGNGKGEGIVKILSDKTFSSFEELQDFLVNEDFLKEFLK